MSDNIKPSLQVTSPTLHLVILFTLLVFVSVLVLSFVLRVEIVARGQGRVIPAQRVQVVQPEFAGQVSAIYVKNGSLVKKGDLLIELDPTEAVMEVNNLKTETERLKIEMLRINQLLEALDADNLAQLNIEEIVGKFSSMIDVFNQVYFNEQLSLLSVELEEVRNNAQQNVANLIANEKSKEITQANIERIESSIEIQDQRLEASEKLLEKGATSKLDYLNVLEASKELENQRNIYLKELNQKQAQQDTIVRELYTYVSTQKSRLVRRRTKIEARLAELSERRVVSERRVNNMKLTAPVDGTVDKLAVFTIGGIASAGKDLMRIVPSGSKPEIEAFFANVDVGFLVKGQQVNIKLDAFPAERFGFVTGKLTSVSADAVESSEGQWGFTVRVTPDTPYLETPVAKHELQSGMTATVDVITGDRNLISYFFAPILKTISDSLGER